MKISVRLGLVMVTLMGLGSAGIASPTQAIRVTELSPQVWSDFERGGMRELVIEFRQGDRLPVSLQADGDLFETGEVSPNYVVLKRSFWIKLEKNHIEMSLDGTIYKPFNQMIEGSLTAGVPSSPTSGGTAGAINLLLKAYLK